MAKIKVKGTEISIITVNNDDYISLTDMLKAKDGEFFISDWLRNRILLNFWVFGKEFIIRLLIMANLP
jgi:hypothetical protein